VFELRVERISDIEAQSWRGLCLRPDDAVIVRAIIQMAHGLQLMTIAEGVESEDRLTCARV
jgi:EAL domain-containing protein (putative c-di-GMP-specific phosphodiesterase class I)